MTASPGFVTASPRSGDAEVRRTSGHRRGGPGPDPHVPDAAAAASRRRSRSNAPGRRGPASVGVHERHGPRLVPPRPAAARPADVPRRPRRRDDRARPVRARPRPARPGGRGPPHLPLPVAAGARRVARRGRLLVVRGDPADGGAARSRRRSTPRPVHVAADFGPYGRERDDAVGEGAGRGRARAGAHRLAVRRGARPGAQGRRRRRSRSSRRSAGPGPSTAGASPPTPTPTPSTWLKPSVNGAVRRSPTTSRVDAELPEAGEDAAHAAVAGRSWTAPVADYDADRDRPDSRAPRACRCTSSRARSTRARCSPTSPGRRSRAPRPTARELAWREFYADVLHQRPESARATT